MRGRDGGGGGKKDLVGVGPKGRRMGGVEYLGVGDLKDLGIIFVWSEFQGFVGSFSLQKGD